MTENKPNLIYLFADQLQLKALGYAGNALAKTTFLDALAANSVNMPNACSGHPLGGPYRASLFTGKYSTSTGMVMNALRIAPVHRTFAHILHDNGYETAFIGKWNMYSAKLGRSHAVRDSFIPADENRLGFDDFFAAYDYHHYYYAPAAYYHTDSSEKRFARGYEPDFQTDLAIEKLREYADKKQPFAMFVSFGTPHDPWTKENVPAKYYDLFRDTDFPLPENYSPKNDPHADAWGRMNKKERAMLPEWQRCYAAMTANLSDNVGRLYEALKQTGLADDTIFVFTSDHGEMFGAHGRREKNIFYDEAVNVPFLIRYGDRLPAGVNLTPLNTVDILPTLMSLMNMKEDACFEGKDLSEAIRNGKQADNACLLMGTGPTAVWGANREWRGLRNDRFTYAVYRADSEEFLFDNIEDPLQMHNLASEPDCKPQLRELKNKLFAEMALIGDDFEPNVFYKKNWITRRMIRPVLPKRKDPGAKR